MLHNDTSNVLEEQKVAVIVHITPISHLCVIAE